MSPGLSSHDPCLSSLDSCPLPHLLFCMEKKITLIDVAKDAGVSRATASLVLRNSALVADATRERVLASMEKLGYVYNRAAASLRAQRSQTIGLVVTDITNPFFAELAVSIESQLDSAGYALMLSNTMDQTEKQGRLLRAMNGRQVDGLLFCPAEGTTHETIAQLAQWNLPTVLIAREIEGASYDYAGADNRLGALLAGRHLIEQGHRKIAFLGGTAHASARAQRVAGLAEAIQEAGMEWKPAYSILSPVSRKGGFAAVQEALALPDPPTAALCYNDVVAFGAMLGLQSMSIHPGIDFALVGFDDIEDAALVRPSLTTVAIKPDDIGKAGIDLLLQRINNPDRPYECQVQTPELMVRETTTISQ